MLDWERTQSFFRQFIEGKYYLTLIEGIEQTLLITALAMVIGVIIGIIIAVIQVMELPSKWRTLDKVLKRIAKLYVDIIRGTPAVAQVSFIWFVILANVELSRTIVGGIAFGINSGAYMAELIRAGIQGIDKGQMEAGRSLGLNYLQTMRYIITPQAFKQMLPAFVSEFINLIKETAVIGYIGGFDIMRAGNIMTAQIGNAIYPLLMVCIAYLVLTGILTKIARALEKRISQGRP